MDNGLNVTENQRAKVQLMGGRYKKGDMAHRTNNN